MGKLGRGVLWTLFPPAGAVASVRAGQKKETRRIVDAIERANQPPPVPVQRTAGGFQQITRADGVKVVLIPPKSLKLQKKWKALGTVKGMQLAQIVGHVGRPDGAPGLGKNGFGFTHTWSRPGYTITIWFSDDEVALGVATERLG